MVYKFASKEVSDRIDKVRRELLDRGFLCLNTCELKGHLYNVLQSWSGRGGVMVYLVFGWDGGWDIWQSIDETNDIEATFRALDEVQKPRPRAEEASGVSI